MLDKHYRNRKNIINYQCNLINYMPLSLSHASKFNFYVSLMAVAQRNGNLSQFTAMVWKRNVCEVYSEAKEKLYQYYTLQPQSASLHPDLLIIFPRLNFSIAPLPLFFYRAEEK